MVSLDNVQIPVTPDNFLKFNDGEITLYLEKSLLQNKVEFLIKDIGYFTIEVNKDKLTIN
ncbi:MAG: hypothetical protein PHR06_14210 [Candidatus Cloacimonetes bacterium]|nr:hypothetical protein [Candidatus Cloacimonadota bacterium]